jgi:hypothetical protein
MYPVAHPAVFVMMGGPRPVAKPGGPVRGRIRDCVCDCVLILVRRVQIRGGQIVRRVRIRWG